MVNCVVGIFTLVATGPGTIRLDNAASSQRSVAGFRFLAGILEVQKSGGLRQTDDGQTKIIENHRSNQTVVKNFVSKGIQLALLFLQLGTACEQDILIIAVPKSKFLISKKKKFVIAPGRKKFQHMHSSRHRHLLASHELAAEAAGPRGDQDGQVRRPAQLRQLQERAAGDQQGRQGRRQGWERRRWQGRRQ